MSAKGDRIERARHDTIAAVVDGLAADGWSVLPALHRWSRWATRPVGEGVLAVAQVSPRGGSSIPADWPLELGVSVGAGYEPVLGQLPLLGQKPDPFLIRDTRWSREGLAANISAPDEVPGAAAQLLGYIRSLAVEFAVGVGGPEALFRRRERGLATRGRSPGAAEGSSGDGPDGLDQESVERLRLRRGEPARLVLLALMSSPDAARAELERRYDAPSKVSPTFPRFARQLRRWLDAGAPPAPPLRETLAVLGGVDMAQTLAGDRAHGRAEAARGRELARTVTAAYRGTDTTELCRRLGEAFAAAGEPAAPSTLAAAAVGALNHRTLGGRLRNARLVGGALLDTGRSLKAAFTAEDVPRLSQVPDADGLPVAGGGRWLVPVLRPEAGALLAAARTDPPRRIGPVSSCTVWLRHDGGPTRVLVGEHVVADVEQEEALLPIWRAAELMQERPVVSGWISQIEPGPPVLELRLPD